MPNITVTSLKRKNDSLKEEIATLRRGFENLQKTLTRNDTQEFSNGGEDSGAITKDEALNNYSSILWKSLRRSPLGS